MCQFADDSFDVVLDKGGLDALMEPEHGSKLGNLYLSEVKRVLKPGGKYICLTLAESHILGLLFPKLRFGWKMSVHTITHKPLEKPKLQTFVVVSEKETSSALHLINSLIDHSSLGCSGNQAFGLHKAIEYENEVRREYSSGSDILYTIEDLQLGAEGELVSLSPGRRLQLILGGPGGSRFSYRAVLLDSSESSGSLSFHCAVFIVPKNRAHEWLFSSEEGQWHVVASSKAARLIMVTLDSTHSNANMDDIQKDLSPLIKQLVSDKHDDGTRIPFMMASDGIKQRITLHKVTSLLTGPITVEDVVYEDVNDDISRILPSGDLIFRRLVFQRNEGLVQSEALLTRDGSLGTKVERKARSSKSKKKGGSKKNNDPGNQLKVYHDHLASSYHMGILSGLVLISSFLETAASAAAKMVNAVVIGLGAGLLPMYLHKCASFLHIEVVELDPMVHGLAKDYFNFTEDEHLKVHIADGIGFISNFKNSAAADEVSAIHENGRNSCSKGSSFNKSCIASQVEGRNGSGVDILIIDVDSSDTSSGMTCPAADFVEESFLLTVKDNLSEQGLFIVNLVSRSPAVKDMVISRMEKVFSHLFGLQLETDVNVVLFGLCSESCIQNDCFPEAAIQLTKLLKFRLPEIEQSIIDTTKKIKCLK
uniref:Methyltransferase-like protein 13 n=1 Tax=Rhizophora mucronata TaxID=61149 RepID=A0A2P2L382_RHIMU